VGTRPEWAGRAEEAVLEEMRRVCLHGLTEEELEQTRNQLKGQLMLSLESTGARLYRLAHFALFDEEFRTLDQVLAIIDGVTADDVREVASQFWDPERQFTFLLGPT
jgi:predicted Zn-dependent peptidase